MKIDGKKISLEIGEKLLSEISPENKPSLGILCVGDDRASISFIKVKKKFGEKYGFVVNAVFLDNQKSIAEIKNTLIKLQEENSGVILQLPLPSEFKNDTEDILSVISKEKDVDVLNGENTFFTAPIVMAFQKVLKNITINKRLATVGLGRVVGLPIRDFAIKNGFTVSEIGANDYGKIKDSDIVVSGIGSPCIIKKENIKHGAVLVDYGCSFVDGFALGDFDPGCYEIASYYTPVPGCMGPLVVASLFENVLDSKNEGF